MRFRLTARLWLMFVGLIPGLCPAATLPLDETPAVESDWGYRPATEAVVKTNPPSFCWRPQKGIVSWELVCRPPDGSSESEYRVTGITLNVHCPPRCFATGRYQWSYRGVDADGQKTDWSRVRTFTIPADAANMPMPTREELLARIPKTHPRLFVRPEDLGRLRGLASGPMQEEFRRLQLQCDKLVANPPPTAEPEKYPAGMERGSDPWRKIWWGNRTYTTSALDGAATLAFTRLLGGKEEYGQTARRILMECAEWDPKGATGYRYNDEAGMPYNYYFARTYTFVYDLLSEEERRKCLAVMKIRGEEMYRHLCPRHLWRPYSSHSNRAWHFLGELGVTFLNEIEGADDWVWFAMNVFYNVYPVWSDDDGGWHEGSAYWSSYLGRFSWWADVMRSSMSVDAYQKPFFSQAGYYAMYLMPPGKRGGGFGDQTAGRTANSNVSLVSVFAAQASNPYWQWYVEQMGGPRNRSGYVGFIRGALPKVEPKAPDDLPSSKLFRGIGQAYLNSTLEDAGEDVQIVFKSSPFGTQSHGYEANNSFLLWAYGRRLLIRSGRRDSYGSDHHRNWMWTTRSVNNITVNGVGQKIHSSTSEGRVTAFATTRWIDVVIGEAGDAYRVDKTSKNPDGKLLDRFTRAVLFIKPELVVVFDRLAARQPSTFEYRLHSVSEFSVTDQRNIDLSVGDVACPIAFLAPEGLSFTQTDQYDPNPRPRVTLREWHLTATTRGKVKNVEFVTLLRPHRAGEDVPRKAELQRVDGGYILAADLSDGLVLILLPIDETATVAADGQETTGKILIQRRRADGTVVQTLTVNELSSQ